MGMPRASSASSALSQAVRDCKIVRMHTVQQKTGMDALPQTLAEPHVTSAAPHMRSARVVIERDHALVPTKAPKALRISGVICT